MRSQSEAELRHNPYHEAEKLTVITGRFGSDTGQMAVTAFASVSERPEGDRRPYILLAAKPTLKA
jgi:hypothetical protein